MIINSTDVYIATSCDAASSENLAPTACKAMLWVGGKIAEWICMQVFAFRQISSFFSSEFIIAIGQMRSLNGAELVALSFSLSIVEGSLSLVVVICNRITWMQRGLCPVARSYWLSIAMMMCASQPHGLRHN